MTTSKRKRVFLNQAKKKYNWRGEWIYILAGVFTCLGSVNVIAGNLLLGVVIGIIAIGCMYLADYLTKQFYADIHDEMGKFDDSGS